MSAQNPPSVSLAPRWVPVAILCLTVLGLGGCDGGNESDGVPVADYVENARAVLQGPGGPAYAHGFTSGLAGASDELTLPSAYDTGRQGSVYSAGFQIARELLAKGEDPEARSAIEEIKAIIQELQPQSRSISPCFTNYSDCTATIAHAVGSSSDQRRPDA